MSESNQTEACDRMGQRMWQRMRGFTIGPVVLILLGLILLSGLIRSRVAADEGMWTFDHPPLRQWKEKYGFEPSGEWLDHIRLSTVRLSEGAGGGTGCLVSADGLIMTNQHVGRGQVAKLSSQSSSQSSGQSSGQPSSGGRDLVRDGFYAASREEELKCPDLEVNILVSYEEVTAQVQAAAAPAGRVVDPAEAAQRRRAAMAEIERRSVAETGLKSEVITLYNGGEYWLYRFKKYTDVRLVFSPEEQIAYYGGDYDNFTYPRYCLDITFFRLYENGLPVRPEHYLTWSEKGAAEGDLVIVPGFPGSTSRLLTVAQIDYQRKYGNPLQMKTWISRRDALKRYGRGGAEQARQSSAPRLALENSIKRLVGQQAGLENPRIFQQKADSEAKLREDVDRRPEWRREYGNAWSEIEKAYAEYPPLAKRLAWSTLAVTRLGTLASTFVRYAGEVGKPNASRYEEFRDNRLDALRLSLLSRAPIYTAMEQELLAAWLGDAQTSLGPDDPFIVAIKAVTGDAPLGESIRAAVAQSRLHDPEFRQRLLTAGPQAIEQSNDPLLRLARQIEPILRQLRTRHEESVISVEAAAGEKIARARFAVYGRTIYPDANFNLRLTYGTVAGYEEDTTLVPAHTTFLGLFDRAFGFDQRPPYQLPARYRDLIANPGNFNLATPFNFVYTADTIGGNSGSPVVNRRGELVGINFDSNIQKLPNRYLYVDEAEGSRAVGVHSLAITEALEKIYHALPLVREIRSEPRSRR